MIDALIPFFFDLLLVSEKLFRALMALWNVKGVAYIYLKGVFFLANLDRENLWYFVKRI